jgi:hypothetical protein
MSIRNPVLFGLKVAFNFSDAESKLQCLSNLGLDIRDLDVIRGINESVDKLDLQNVSGLDVNLTRYLDRLKSDTGLYSGIVNELGGYQYTLQGNLEAFGPLSGGAVRYQYIPNDKGTGLTKADLKYGDISTSRVSSWSGSSTDETDTEQAISYGASVQVRGTVKVGQKGSWSGPGPTEAVINVLDTPEPIRFATEVATDVLEIELNGNTRYIYAMRGIPIIFTTAFKNISMDFRFTAIPSGNPIFTLQATDGSESEIQSTPPVSGGTSRLRYNGPSYKERFVKVYYPPNNIIGITANSLNIRNLPAVKFFELQDITIASNLIGEMPDWRDITYAYDRTTPTNAPNTNLTYIDISNNPLNQTDEEELQQFGTDVIERLPRTLVTLTASGTYNAHTTFKTLNESCVLICTQTEYNSIAVNPTTKQDYDFSQILTSGGSAVTTNIDGYFWDKQVHPVSGEYLVYIKEPKLTKDSSWLSSDVSSEADWQQLVQSSFDLYKDYFLPVNLATRCPNLQTLNMRNSSGRRIYKNTNTKGPDPSGTLANVSYQTSHEYTPTVDLETIRTYDVYDNSYTKLSDIFVNPSTYISGASTLASFNVAENESLSQPADSVDFSKMTQISSINIVDTALPVPSGLAGNSSLRTLSCNYARFPSRSTSNPAAYSISHPSGGYVDANGDGNPSGRTNHLFNNKWPTQESEYALTGCSNLSSLSFYASRLDGMIPKFVGNGSLTTIDFRYTDIEGGRPKDPNSNLSGRRYVMWDDTFEDAQSIQTIRIRSGELGRNIGIYNPSTQAYTEASFQGATFNLPLLQTLEIVSTNKLLRGTFFNTGGAPNLVTLKSPSSGWGLDIVGGAPVPSFGANPNLVDVDLSGNNFSGNIVLTGASKLQKFYVNSNIIDGIDLNNFSGLNALQYFIVSNNQMTGQFPNFSVAAPNVQYISFANNLYGTPSPSAPFTPGLFDQCTRLRSLDLSNNSLNESTVDDILLEMVANYNNAPRTGVVVNLQGNAAPSSVTISTPTTTTTTQIDSFTVSQTDPLNPQQSFFRPQDFTIDIKDGQDPGNPNFSYSTVIKQDGTDITSLLNIDYANDTFSYTGSSFPPDGASIEITVTTVEQGFETSIEGGVVTAQQLRNLGWIVRTA